MQNPVRLLIGILAATLTLGCGGTGENRAALSAPAARPSQVTVNVTVSTLNYGSGTIVLSPLTALRSTGSWRGCPVEAETNPNGGNLPSTFLRIALSSNTTLILRFNNCSIAQLADKVRIPNDQNISYNGAGYAKLSISVVGASVGPVQG
jgi:hypothetical protein